MIAVKAYYNGQTFVPLQNYTFKPHQKVLIIVDDLEDTETPAEKFLKLSWAGDETAEEIIKMIEKERVNSDRFGEKSELFD